MTREKEFVPVRDIAHYLIKTNHELKRINSQNATTPKELEALSLKVWKCHEAADLRMKQLDAEKEHIKTTLKRTWDLFAETIAPAMKIDDDLVPIYTTLTAILEGLESLEQSRVSQETLAADLAVWQGLLHGLEEKKDPVLNQFCVKRKNELDTKIPFGQAVCSSLLNRCYKIAHRLACAAEAGVKEPRSELQDLIFSLGTILETIKNGKSIDPILLKLIADDLLDMENAKVDGVFYEKDGSVATNQKQVKKEMQTAHDLLNECVAFMFKAGSGDSSTESIQTLLRKVEQARENLELQVEDDYRNSDDLQVLMAPVHDAIVHFKEEAGSAINSTKNLLSSVVQSAFRLANDIFEKTGPIDPKLVPIYDKVNDILSRLKVIRNSRNWEKLQQHQVNQPPIFEIYGEELQKIDLELQELSKQHLNGDWQVFNDDGTIVDAGQEMVSNLYNHAVVLLNDLLFHG